MRLGRCILLYLLFSEVRVEYYIILFSEVRAESIMLFSEVRAEYSIIYIIFRG